jgi:hypothetical protein
VTPDAIIRDALIHAARTLGAPEPIDPVVERPRDSAFGDWTTNLAMTLARTLRRKPTIRGRLDVMICSAPRAKDGRRGFITTGSARRRMVVLLTDAPARGVLRARGKGATFNGSSCLN